MTQILDCYLTNLDLLISDLQHKLDAKEEEFKKKQEEIDGLTTRVEENEDVIKVKQR